MIIERLHVDQIQISVVTVTCLEENGSVCSGALNRSVDLRALKHFEAHILAVIVFCPHSLCLLYIVLSTYILY